MMQFADKKAENLIVEASESLRLIYGEKLRKILIFGSYSRSAETMESDMDIMVLLDMDEKEIACHSGRVVTLMSTLVQKYGILPSIIEENFDHFQNHLEILPFYSNVNGEGIVVYAR